MWMCIVMKNLRQIIIFLLISIGLFACRDKLNNINLMPKTNDITVKLQIIEDNQRNHLVFRGKDGGFCPPDLLTNTNPADLCFDGA